MSRISKAFIVTALSASPLVSWAGAQLDLRMDHLSRSGNTKSAIKPSAAFQVQRARLLMKGGLGDMNEYTVRLNLLNSSESVIGDKKIRDNASKFVDYAFIKRKLTDDWSVSMGKIILGMGGVEGTNNPADYYLPSVAGTEVSDIYWAGGVSLDTTIQDHSFKLAAANLSEDVADAPAGTTLQQTRNLLGLVYSSKLLDGMIQPNVSYYTENFESSKDSVTKKNNYMAVGARMKFEPVVLELDYLNNAYGNDPKGAGSKVSTNSIIALVRYNFLEASSVHLKLENSSAKVLDATLSDAETKYAGTTLAFEYKPMKDENWRAHVAVTQKTTKVTGVDDSTEQKIMVGMRMVADILK